MKGSDRCYNKELLEDLFRIFAKDLHNIFVDKITTVLVFGSNHHGNRFLISHCGKYYGGNSQ